MQSWVGRSHERFSFAGGRQSDQVLRQLTFERADENARRLGMDRRQFLASSMGMCAALLTIDEVTACSARVSETSRSSVTGRGEGGKAPPDAGGIRSNAAASDAGGRCIPKEAAFDESCANAIVGGSEFIFDVETHWFNPADLTNYSAYQSAFGPLFASATEDAYVQELFCNSDTRVACLTPLPGTECTATRKIGCGMPLTNESIVTTAEIKAKIFGLNAARLYGVDPSAKRCQVSSCPAT